MVSRDFHGFYVYGDISMSRKRSFSLADRMVKLFGSIFLCNFDGPDLRNLMGYAQPHQGIVSVDEIALPEEVSEYEVKLVLSDGSSVGIAYLISESWGWIASVFHEIGAERVWGQYTNSTLFSDMLRSLSDPSQRRAAQRVLRLYYDRFFPEDSSKGVFAIGCLSRDGNAQFLGKDTARDWMMYNFGETERGRKEFSF